MVGKQTKTRRGHGEGNIRERSDGRWEARYTLPDGKRRSIFAKTKADAQRQLRNALHDLDRGVIQVDVRSTVETQLRAWLMRLAHSHDNATVAQYRMMAEQHLIPAIGHIRLVALKSSHLDALWREKLADGYAPASVRSMRATLVAALQQAVRDELLPRNVATLSHGPKGDQEDMQVFTQEQAAQFLDAAVGHPLEALFVTALGTGMREGELLGLHWADVQFERGVIAVRWNLQANRTKVGERAEDAPIYLMKRPKTQSSRRVVRAPQLVFDTLRAHRIEQGKQRLRMGEAWQPYDLVFCGALGQPLAAQSVRRQFHQLVASVDGLPPLRFHDLRHTCATLLLRANIHPKVVSDLLGHASIAMTLNTYSHVLPDMQADAADQLSMALRPSTTAGTTTGQGSRTGTDNQPNNQVGDTVNDSVHDTRNEPKGERRGGQTGVLTTNNRGQFRGQTQRPGRATPDSIR